MRHPKSGVDFVSSSMVQLATDQAEMLSAVAVGDGWKSAKKIHQWSRRFLSKDTISSASVNVNDTSLFIGCVTGKSLKVICD